MADHQGMDPSELNTKGKEKVEEVLTNRFKELQKHHFRPAAHVYTQGANVHSDDGYVLIPWHRHG